MKERLVIENFGPIKHVDLNLNKINIFIGPNASGKSTISKIIGIVKNAELYNHFNKKNDKNWINLFLDNLNIFTYINSKSIIKYENDKYKILKTAYKKNISLKDVDINFTDKDFTDKSNLFKIFTSKLDFSKLLFIPMERSFISTVSSSLMSLITNDVSLPKYITSFGSDFEKARKYHNIYYIDFMNINYSFQDNIDIITSKKDGNRILLSESASSIQSVVPLFLTMIYSTVNFIRNHFVIEEPELNLFPETQKGLVSFLTENTYKNNNSLTVNTHSPYILMALNNLIEADNVLKELKKGKTDNKILSERKEEIKKIVKSEKFIDFDDIAVYYIHSDGTAEDIKDYENRLINAEKIDSVSDIFADEVDALADIKFQ
ncbi:MAG: hypothetical protein DRI94_03545 [Bacteroidetes bacterium]|nr:MAG: hypothetical protein DRI94_03545 [Bacteroidota bacterium]